LMVRAGLFPDPGRARPARRHQFALAAVRHRQPDARRHRAVPGHHDYSENATGRSAEHPSARIEGEPHAETVLGAPKRSPWLALITLVPLIWLVAVTFTASVEKIFHPDPRIGFLAQAKSLSEKERELQRIHTLANLHSMNLAVAIYAKPDDTDATAKLTAQKQVCNETWKAVAANRTLRFNNLLDATVAGIFLALVIAIVLLSLREWFLLLSRRKPAMLHETEPVWLPDYAVVEGGRKVSGAAGAAALALALAKEWSGESHLEHAQQQARAVCECHPAHAQQIYVKATEQRFNGVRRCC